VKRRHPNPKFIGDLLERFAVRSKPSGKVKINLRA